MVDAISDLLQPGAGMQGMVERQQQQQVQQQQQQQQQQVEKAAQQQGSAAYDQWWNYNQELVNYKQLTGAYGNSPTSYLSAKGYTFGSGYRDSSGRWHDYQDEKLAEAEKDYLNKINQKITDATKILQDLKIPLPTSMPSPTIGSDTSGPSYPGNAGSQSLVIKPQGYVAPTIREVGQGYGWGAGGGYVAGVGADKGIYFKPVMDTGKSYSYINSSGERVEVARGSLSQVGPAMASGVVYTQGGNAKTTPYSQNTWSERAGRETPSLTGGRIVMTPAVSDPFSNFPEGIYKIDNVTGAGYSVPGEINYFSSNVEPKDTSIINKSDRFSYFVVPDKKMLAAGGSGTKYSANIYNFKPAEVKSITKPIFDISKTGTAFQATFHLFEDIQPENLQKDIISFGSRVKDVTFGRGSIGEFAIKNLGPKSKIGSVVSNIQEQTFALTPLGVLSSKSPLRQATTKISVATDNWMQTSPAYQNFLKTSEAIEAKQIADARLKQQAQQERMSGLRVEAKAKQQAEWERLGGKINNFLGKVYTAETKVYAAGTKVFPYTSVGQIITPTSPFRKSLEKIDTWWGANPEYEKSLLSLQSANQKLYDKMGLKSPEQIQKEAGRSLVSWDRLVTEPTGKAFSTVYWKTSELPGIKQFAGGVGEWSRWDLPTKAKLTSEPGKDKIIQGGTQITRLQEEPSITFFGVETKPSAVARGATAGTLTVAAGVMTDKWLSEGITNTLKLDKFLTWGVGDLVKAPKGMEVVGSAISAVDKTFVPYMIASAAVPQVQQVQSTIGKNIRQKVSDLQQEVYSRPNVAAIQNQMNEDFGNKYGKQIQDGTMTYDNAVKEYSKSSNYKDYSTKLGNEYAKSESWKTGAKIFGLNTLDWLTPETPKETAMFAAEYIAMFRALPYAVQALQNYKYIKPVINYGLSGGAIWQGIDVFKPTVTKEERIKGGIIGTIGALGLYRQASEDISYLKSKDLFNPFVKPSGETQEYTAGGRKEVSSYGSGTRAVLTRTTDEGEEIGYIVQTNGEKSTAGGGLEWIKTDAKGKIIDDKGDTFYKDKGIKTLKDYYNKLVDKDVYSSFKDWKGSTRINLNDQVSAQQYWDRMNPVLKDKYDSFDDWVKQGAPESKFMHLLTPKDNLRKELFEETGLGKKGSGMTPVEVYNSLEKLQSYRGARYSSVFKIDVTNTKLTPGSDVADIKWVPKANLLDEIGNRLSTAYRPYGVQSPGIKGVVKDIFLPGGGVWNVDSANILLKTEALDEIRSSGLVDTTNKGLVSDAKSWISKNYGKRFVDTYTPKEAVEEYLLAKQFQQFGVKGLAGGINPAASPAGKFNELIWFGSKTTPERAVLRGKGGRFESWATRGNIADFEAPGTTVSGKNIVIDLDNTLVSKGQLRPGAKEQLNLLAKKNNLILWTHSTADEAATKLGENRIGDLFSQVITREDYALGQGVNTPKDIRLVGGDILIDNSAKLTSFVEKTGLPAIKVSTYKGGESSGLTNLYEQVASKIGNEGKAVPFEDVIWFGQHSRYKFGMPVIQDYLKVTTPEKMLHAAPENIDRSWFGLGNVITVRGKPEIQQGLFFQPPVYPTGSLFAGTSYLGISGEQKGFSLLGPNPQIVTQLEVNPPYGQSAKTYVGRELEAIEKGGTTLKVVGKGGSFPFGGIGVSQLQVVKVPTPQPTNFFSGIGNFLGDFIAGVKDVFPSTTEVTNRYEGVSSTFSVPRTQFITLALPSSKTKPKPTIPILFSSAPSKQKTIFSSLSVPSSTPSSGKSFVLSAKSIPPSRPSGISSISTSPSSPSIPPSIPSVPPSRPSELPSKPSPSYTPGSPSPYEYTYYDTFKKIPKSIDKFKSKSKKYLLKKKPSVPGYLVFTKRARKPLLLTPKPIPKGEALALGVSVTKKSALASFRIVPAKEAGVSMGIKPLKEIEVYKQGYRPPVKFGMVMPSSTEFIQTRRTRMGTPKEVRAVQSARRLDWGGSIRGKPKRSKNKWM